MRNFDANIIAELAKEIARSFWMVELQLTSTYRYTNADIDLYSGGNKYISMPFEIKEIQQSNNFSVDSVTLEFSNVDLAIGAILLGEDVANKTAILSLTMLDSDYQEIDLSELYRGYITSWELTELRATLTLANEFNLWRKKTLRLPAASCPWVFKGTECGYSGSETWCDQSVERCKALSNYDNFGGRRYILSIEDKKIYWGPKGY